MKCVILAGGFGTRLAEETTRIPKPMVEIGGRPILWHIMKIYSAHGINDFVICLGYKGYVIGRLEINDGQVTEFSEKPQGDGGLINGGYFVLSPKVEKYLEDDKTIWERAPLMGLADEGELMAYQHRGFWQPMDTIRERQELEEHWSSGNAPWKIWKD